MKITRKQLRQIIKEELALETSSHNRRIIDEDAYESEDSYVRPKEERSTAVLDSLEVFVRKARVEVPPGHEQTRLRFYVGDRDYMSKFVKALSLSGFDRGRPRIKEEVTTAIGHALKGHKKGVFSSPEWYEHGAKLRDSLSSEPALAEWERVTRMIDVLSTGKGYVESPFFPGRS